MDIKVIFLIFTIVIQILGYVLKPKTKYFLPYFVLNIYTIKSVTERYLPLLDTILQISIIIGLTIQLIKITKKGSTIKYNKYLLLILLLIILNGIYNSLIGNTINVLYITGLLNYSFIVLIILFLGNTIQTKTELKETLSMTKYNGILLFTYAVYDKFVLGLSRVGDLINPNYMAQMSLILLLFYYYATGKKMNFWNILYYTMLVITIVWTDSSSGMLGLITIIMSFLLFNLKSKKLIILSNYAIWILMFFFMSIIIFTSNFEYGLMKHFVKSEDISRVYIWQYTFEEIKSNPIIGNLYNTFRSPWGNIELVTHNDYLRLMVELGIGSVITLFILVKKQVKLLSSYSKNDGFFLYSFIMITLLFSLSHNNINNLMFWLALSIPSFEVYKCSNEFSGGELNESSKFFS